MGCSGGFGGGANRIAKPFSSPIRRRMRRHDASVAPPDSHDAATVTRDRITIVEAAPVRGFLFVQSDSQALLPQFAQRRWLPRNLPGKPVS